MDGPPVSGELDKDLAFDREQMGRVMEKLLVIASQPQLSSEAEVSHSALLLTSLYQGAEEILQILRSNADKPALEGSAWHQRLLQEYEGDPTFPFDSMKKLMAFRHMVRHTYSFELIPERVWEVLQLTVQMWPSWERWLGNQLEENIN